MPSKLTERLAIVAASDPDLVDDAANTTDWASLVAGQQILFILNVGQTDITLDAKIQQATDSSGTGAADIAGLALTQVAGTGDDKQYAILVRDTDLTGANTHVAMVITVGDGTVGAYISAVGVRIDNRYDPATANDVASVAEIITS